MFEITTADLERQIALALQMDPPERRGISDRTKALIARNRLRARILRDTALVKASPIGRRRGLRA